MKMLLDLPLWNLVLSAGFAMLGWAARTMYGDIRKLDDEIRHVAINYVQKTDLAELKQELHDNFKEVKEMIRNIKP